MIEAISYIHPTAELSPGLFFLIQIVTLARQEAVQGAWGANLRTRLA
jgi:hypothetical protein